MPMRCVIDTKVVNYPGGHAGQAAAAISPSQIPKSTAGNKGVITTGSALPRVVANLVTTDYAALLLHRIELDYLNGEVEAAVARLQWLDALLGVTPSNSIFIAQKIRLRALARQMSLGLDYYGNYQNFVTLLSPDYYAQLIKQMLEYGRDIEYQYQAYVAADAIASDRIAAFSRTQANVLSNAEGLEASLPQIVQEQQALQETIDGLRDDLSDLWIQLQTAEAAFKAAVKSAGGGCSFEQLVTIGAAVGTLVATGGSAAAAIGPALAALNGPGSPGENGLPIPDDFSGFKYEVTTVVTAGQKIGDFAVAANKVAQSITPTADNNSVPALPSDQTKLLAQASDIDKQLQPFLSKFGEARTYQALIHTYVSTAESRNNKILEYNNKRSEYTRTKAQISVVRATAAELQTRIATVKASQIPGATTFMEDAYLQARVSIIRILYEIDRCQRFVTLAPPMARFEIGNATIGGLSSVALQQTASYHQAQAGFGMGLIALKNRRVGLRDFVSNPDFAKFQDTGVLVFSLPHDRQDSNFYNYSHVLAQQIAFEFRGLAKNVAFSVVVKHLGRSVMRDGQGTAQVFSHVALATTYAVDARGQPGPTGSLTGDSDPSDPQRFVGVSPYGPWKIAVTGLTDEQRSKISDIDVIFDARGRTIARG